MVSKTAPSPSDRDLRGHRGWKKKLFQTAVLPKEWRNSDMFFVFF